MYKVFQSGKEVFSGDMASCQTYMKFASKSLMGFGCKVVSQTENKIELKMFGSSIVIEIK